MGANLDFIQNNIINHVWNYDNWSIALAFNGCAEEDCEVRTYGAGATQPTWARFSSPNARGPDDSYWWVFEYVGNDPPEIMTSMNAPINQDSPILGSTLASGVISVSSISARPPPMPKVIRRTRVLSIPRPCARFSFMMTARV